MDIRPAPEAAEMVVLALDVGGTQIRAAAVLPDGSRLGRRAAPTPLALGAEAIFAACADLLRGVADGLPAQVRGRVAAIGISSVGPVDPWRGLVVDPPNVPPLRDAPLADEMETRLGLPAFLDRDTNVAALAEHWLGAARGCRDFLYVTVSTGLGGAVVHDGRLMLGPDGTAGELGHVTLMMDGGPRCGCGGTGHLEGIAAGAGLAAQARDEVALGNSAFLLARAELAPLTARDVAEGELAGDPACELLMQRARRAFAVACVGWVDAFNPTLIVVGGTLAERQGERWLGAARAEVESSAFRAPAARVRIVPAQLGDDVGLVGAWPLVALRSGDPTWREKRSGRLPGERPADRWPRG
ncbi:MAG: ROK family protein [Candidatus Limnocylindrales bacterium]|jgi:glucokinase